MLTRTSLYIKTTMSNIIFICAFLAGNPVSADTQPVENTEPATSDQAVTETATSPTTETQDATTTADAPSVIARSQFTTAIVDREPTDDVIMLTNNSEQIYFFTELANLKGQQVTHRWKYQGKIMAEVTFDVKSDRWRVYSSKKIKPDWIGKWSVVLVGENGNTLNTSKLDVVEATSSSN